MSSHIARSVGLARCANRHTCRDNASNKSPALIPLPTVGGFPLSYKLEYPSATDGGRRVAVVARAASKTEKAAKTLTPLEVKETPEDNSRLRLTVTVPADRCNDAWQKTLREIQKTAKIDGFRKGDRVPEWLLVRNIGEKEIKMQALDTLLKATLNEALQSVAGRALRDSEHITTSADDMVAAYSPTEPLSYDVTVDVISSIAWTSERAYASLAVQVEAEPEDDATVAAAVDVTIRAQLKNLGRLSVSTKAGLEMGDVAIVDLTTHRITEDNQKGEPILSATLSGFQVDTEEARLLLPGMLEALLGIAREESREFDLTFPASWHQESLRNTPARFNATCKELFIREVPELTDEVAEQLLAGAGTVDQLKERLANTWRQSQQQKKKQATYNALLAALEKVCQLTVPPSLLEEQGRQMYGAKLIELQAGGRLRKEEVERLMSESMVNNYLRTQKDKIEAQVKQALAVDEVFRQEGLKFSAEELQAEFESAVSEFKRFNQEYDEKRVKEQAAEVLQGAKVLDFLLENATVSYVTPTPAA